MATTNILLLYKYITPFLLVNILIEVYKIYKDIFILRYKSLKRNRDVALVIVMIILTLVMTLTYTYDNNATGSLIISDSVNYTTVYMEDSIKNKRVFTVTSTRPKNEDGTKFITLENGVSDLLVNVEALKQVTVEGNRVVVTKMDKTKNTIKLKGVR